MPQSTRRLHRKHSPRLWTRVLDPDAHITFWQCVVFLVWFALAGYCVFDTAPYGRTFYAVAAILFAWHAAIWFHDGYVTGLARKRGGCYFAAVPVMVALMIPLKDLRRHIGWPHEPMKSLDWYVGASLFLCLSTYPWYVLGSFIARRRTR